MTRFRTFLLLAVFGAALAVPASASATITNVFANDPYGATNPAGGIPCTVQTGANAGIRLCTATTRSTVPSFDGVPIDVNVMFPPEANTDNGTDQNWPMVMLFHGYGGQKSGLASNTLRWINKGYAVMSPTARGFYQSCGQASARTAAGTACNNGYIRLMDYRYEIRDVQELAGMLVDQGVVDPNRIGANGGSYGGGESLALATLNNRKMLTDGTLVPWTSPVNGTPMKIAAAAPEAPWSDLAYSLNPTGSNLDYSSTNSYLRPGVNRAGTQKQLLNASLYSTGNLVGYYCGASGSPTAGMSGTATCADADVTAWNNLANTGGPYDTGANAALQTYEINQLDTYHSTNYLDNSTAPSPTVISNGWNDDLFPVDEGVRYVQRQLTAWPAAHLALFDYDEAVHARGQGKAADNALLTTRENDWFDYYVKGSNATQPQDGVDTLTTTCPSTAASAGPFHTATWQAQAPGEIRYTSPASQTIQPTIASGAITTFQGGSGGPCGTASATDNASTANYRFAVPAAGSYTILGSPTIVADYTLQNTNDQVAVRLFDVDSSGNESLVARGLLRPKVDPGPVRQVFQLHPQGYTMLTGHTLKLELLPNDAQYGRANPATPDEAAQHAVTVSNLELRLPVRESAGALGGVVKSPADKILPAGYTFAAGYAHVEPETTIDTAPATLTNNASPSIPISSSENYATFECKLDGPGAATGTYGACTNPKAYSSLADGTYTFSTRSTSQGGTTDSTPATTTFTVDATPPDTIIDSGRTGASTSTSADFTFHSPDATATFECGIDNGPYTPCTSPQDYTGLADGSHTVNIRAVDQAGNADQTPASNTFVVDTTPPDTSIDTGPTGRTGAAFPTFSFSSTETGSTFECQVDSAAFAACTSPTTIGRLSDGPHTFTVRATDAVGNTDPTPASRSITVDTTGPDATINSGPSGQVNSAAASFTFTTPESGATFECQLDGSAFTACTSPQSYASLSEGAHVFRVRALDDLGNPGTSDQRNFTVDTIAPDTVIDSGPQGPTNDVTPSFSFHSTETGSTFECKLDSGAFEACSSPRAYGPLAEGPHTFTVRATDGATNTDQTPASSDFTVDTTVPETSIDSGPSGPTADNTPTYEFSSPDATATFQCRTDSDAFAACASPFTTAALADGDHTFEVRAVDPAGNIDQTPDSRSITVDTTAPETTIDSGVSGPTSNTAPSFTFSSPDATATFECSLDADPFSACTSPQAYTDLADGDHTFSVRAVDPLGNTDQSPDIRSFTVDTVAPDTSIDTGPSGLTADNTPTYTFSSPDNTAVFQCSIDDADFASCTSPVTTDALSDGSHTFRVRAVDPALNADPTPASSTINVDTTPPNTTINFGPQGPTSNTAPTFGFSSTEAGSTFECRVDSDAFSPCTSPKTIAAQTPGAHTFSVRATDPAANTDPTPATRSFTVDVTGPSSQIDTGPDGLTNDPSPTFTFSSSKPNSTFNCQVDGGAVSPCSSPFTVSPDLADGDHTFDVQAIDSAGNTETGFSRATFTVDATAPETTITDQPPATSNNPDPSFAFSSEPGATFECKLDSAAYAPCSSPQDYTGLAAGPHTFSVRATDSAANTDQTPASADFTIDTAAPDTSIDTGPSGTTNVADPTFTFSSSEANSTFECQVDSDAFAPCTSPLHLSALSEGEHTFSVRATDASENTDPSAATRTFTVDTTAPETTIDSATLSGTSATATFHSEAGATFECKLDSGAFSPCTSPKTFSGLTPGDHTIAVRATDTAGNTDQTPDTRTVTVADVTPPPDTTAPETTITSSAVSGTSVTFSFASSEAGSTFECRIDGAAFAPCTSPKTYDGLAAGGHTFDVRATDSAGNTDATPASGSVTVASPPPAAVPPKITPVRSILKVPGGGRVVVATIRCPDGTCRVGAPKRVPVKIAGKTYAAVVKVSARIGEGGTAKVKLILSKSGRKALARSGRGHTRLRLTVSSSNGTRAAMTAGYSLKALKK